jgi:sterol desaturase/sphingolipid hydroxylase (fatty acid hydroxylase superfamily)
MEIVNKILTAYANEAKYLFKMIAHPFENGLNSFYFLILVSLFVWGLEIIWPWRRNQKVIRKDFWLDTFYMFFNYFFFNLLIYAALSTTTQNLFSGGMEAIGFPKSYVFNFMGNSSEWLRILVFFLLYDLIQWSVHNLLHRIPFLWRFHRVHHSVTEMGFAAHLRYHFMENVVYRIFLYTFLSYLLHFDLPNLFLLYAITTLIGHLNHANMTMPYGPLKYILNNQRLHIWHHAKALPESHPKGMNFAISLSIWDYLFGTMYMPYDGRDIELGFKDVEKFPKDFLHQQTEAFKKERS